MEDILRSEFVASGTAPVVVLFGGNPYRREEVISIIESLGDISVYGALSLEEGLKLLNEIPKVDLVLIGGRYTTDQRSIIKQYLAKHFKDVEITEPGYEYPYTNDLIKAHILNKISSKRT